MGYWTLILWLVVQVEGDGWGRSGNSISELSLAQPKNRKYMVLPRSGLIRSDVKLVQSRTGLDWSLIRLCDLDSADRQVYVFWREQNQVCAAVFNGL